MSTRRANPAAIFDDWTGFPDSGAPVKTPPREAGSVRAVELPADAPGLAEFLTSLGQRGRLSFLEHVAHELTVCLRSACGENGLSRVRKLEHARRISEILHRVVLRTRWLRLGKDSWREPEFAEMVFEWIEGDAVLRERVLAGLRRAHAYHHKRGT